MNRGDTLRIYLNYKINGEPLEKGAYDEIELQFNEDRTANAVKLKMTDGRVQYDDEKAMYYADLKQEDTFKLKQPFSVQLRIMNAGHVCSSNIGHMELGDVLSKEVLNV